MGATAPYVLTWGSSHWDNADSDWSTPGPQPLTVGPIEAVSTVGHVTQVTFVRLTVTPAIVATSDVAIQSTGAYVAPDNSGIYVSATTARVYDSLPAAYRDDDAAIVAFTFTSVGGTLVYDSGTTYDGGSPYDDGASTGTVIPDPIGNYPLLRYLSCLVDQAGAVESTIDSFIPPTSSALTDPMQAATGWLPWLGQLVGLTINPSATNEAQARAEIATALTGAPRGSKQSIINAVMPALSGTQSVTVTDHYLGDPWKICVATIGVETPPNLSGAGFFTWGTSTWGVSTEWNEPDPIVQLLNTANQKPAGFQIVHTRS